MAYRAPRYAYLHAIRDLGVSSITLSQGSAHADFPVDNLIDDRAGTIFKYAAPVNSPRIVIDLGANFVTGIDRVIIPANHNFTNMGVEGDDNASFTSVELLSNGTAEVAGVMIDRTLDNPTSERYIRILINGGTAQYQIPQIVLTTTQTFDVGPVLAESVDELKANVTRLQQPSGLLPTVQNGPNQRAIEYDYERALLDGGGSTDLPDMEALIASVGMHRPFFVDPASFSTPPETDEPVLWMKFQEMPRSVYTVKVPMSNTRAKTFRLRLIESLD